jgi:16S rRNA (guanine527-N7)-methyltransferase
MVELLGLAARVRVFRGRAEDAVIVAAVGGSDWVTARAVAPLNRLAGWCVPLLHPGGRLLAMKGSSATAEVAQHRTDLRRLGVSNVETVQCGAAVLDEAATVVVATRDSDTLRGGSRRGKDRS